MADGVTVEVRGVAELQAGTVTLADHIGKASRDSFRTVAEQAANQIRGRLHRDTGATVGSVTVSALALGAALHMGDGVPYAQYEEYGGRGWPHSSTGNFLYPAAMGAEPQLVQAADKTASEQIGAMRWPSP